MAVQDQSPTRWLATAAASVLVLEALRFTLQKHFSLDEFQYAHAAWLVAQGQVPYRDFFEVHFPLVYLWLAPWLLPFEASAFGSALALRAGMLPLVAVATFGVWRLGARESRATGALSVAALWAVPDFTAFATELRPDAAGAALLLGCLGALERCAATPAPGTRRRWGFAAGLLLAACLWSTQKAAVSCAPLLLAVAVANLTPRLRAVVAAPRAVLAGLATGASAAAVYLVGTSSLGAFWRWCFVWAAEHQRGYPGFGLDRDFLPMLQRQAWFFALAAVGVAVVLRRWRTCAAGPAGLEGLLVWSLPAAFAAIALQRAPFPYSFLPLLAVAAPLAARGAVALLAAARPPLLRAAATLALVGLGASQLVALERRFAPSSADQLATLKAVDALTLPTDVVYDNSGGFIARPHAHFFFYTDAYLRGSRAEELAREVPRALLDTGCVAVLSDLRASGLPAPLRQFLAENYQPYDADLSLWGRRFEVAAGALEDRFYAVQAGWYFARWSSGTLTVDGEARERAPFWLARGWHQVQYRGPDSEFELLWLPRNREPWAPRRGLAPGFSRLF